MGQARENTRTRRPLPHSPHPAASGADVASPRGGRAAESSHRDGGGAAGGPGSAVEVGAWGGATSGLRTSLPESQEGRQAKTSGPREAAAEENRPVGGSRGQGECRLPGRCPSPPGAHAAQPGPRLACCLDPVTFLDCQSDYENASALPRDSLT